MPPDIAETVRRHDPDRFLTTLFAPAAGRDALLCLYAFNHELARAREVTGEPGLALIRLQWWRETVEGAERRHEIAGPVATLLQGGRLPRAKLLAMIEAREAEADPAFPTVQAWWDHLLAGPGSVASAAGEALGGSLAQDARWRRLGAGYGAAGWLHGVAAHARQGRCLLPADRLAAQGLTASGVVAAPGSPEVARVVAGLAAETLARVGPAGPAVGPDLAAGLVGVLARRDLTALSRPDGAVAFPRGFGDRFAVARAAWLGRV